MTQAANVPAAQAAAPAMAQAGAPAMAHAATPGTSASPASPASPADDVGRSRSFRRSGSRSRGRLRHTNRSSSRASCMLAAVKRIVGCVSPLGWVFLALAIVCIALFCWRRWGEMLAMGTAFAIMCACAVAMSLGNTAFEAKLGASRTRVKVDERVDVTVTVTNPSASPTAAARAELPIADHHERFGIPILKPHESKVTDVSFTAVSRAVLHIGPLTVRKGDPFGLMRREKRLADELTVLVHPAIIAIPPLHAGLPRDLEGHPQSQVVDDDLDFYGLRSYEPGDDIRHIHWLSSAKSGDLMLRQYQETRRTDTSLTLDAQPADYASAEEFELAVSVHASIGVQCLAENRALFTDVGSVHRHPKNGLEFLDWCSMIEPETSAEAANLAHMTLRNIANASLYVITVGSLMPLDAIKRIAASMPRSASCIVVQTIAGATPALQRFPRFILATVGNLADLPAAIGALK